MKAIGKIGVIIPDIYDMLEQELIEGIYMQAKELGYDVLVFSDTCNAMPEYRHYPEIVGFYNIYQLPLLAELDGILFCAARFSDEVSRSQIYDDLQKLSVPCLVIGEKTQRFPYIISDQLESIYQMTKHLIDVHNCRKLYCLTGLEGNENSIERIKGFCKAMEEKGLPVDDSMIFYGDFWKEKPRQLGLDIAHGRIEKPDAVVCASDVMAISLCEALMENGVSVPEDIAVTGYDGGWFSALSTPKITTICGGESRMGFMAVCRIYEMITGRACEAECPRQYIKYGTSCGCHNEFDSKAEKYITNMMNRCRDQKIHISSNFSYPISKAESMMELTNTIYSYSYLLSPVVQYAICLCEDWQFDFENTAVCREQGFSERMIFAIGRSAEGNPVRSDDFLLKELVPDLAVPHEPQLKVFISLHRGVQIFGYIAVTYNDGHEICLDDHFMNWCNVVANGFDALQKKHYQHYIRQQLETLSVIDPATGLYNKRGLMEQLPGLPARSSESDQGYICILISYVCRKSHSEKHGSDLELMIANALRLSSDNSELLCRLQSDLFAAVLPAEDDDIQRTAERRIMRLEEKMRYIQGSVLQRQMPELVTEHGILQFDKLSKAEALISDMQQQMLQKAEAAAIVAGGSKERLHRMRREIFASPEKEWSISEAAGLIGISVSHFQRMYKSEFGITFKEELITARLEKAKKLLRSTDLRVQEISDACGYNDYSHFMRQFKDKVGTSALQYRKQKDIYR